MELDLVNILLSGAGGAVLGPLVSQFLGGKNSGLLTRIVTGIVGGAGAGAGLDQTGAFDLAAMLGDGQTMSYVASLIEGGVGGGVLATIAGILTKKR